MLLVAFHAPAVEQGESSTIRSAESLPILDLHALSDTQLDKAEDIFDEFRDKELKPAYIADADPNRALLDKRVVCDLLGFDQATYEGRPPPLRQMVRGALSPRRQAQAERGWAAGVIQ